MCRWTIVLLGVLLWTAGCAETEDAGVIVGLDPTAAPEPVHAKPPAAALPEPPRTLWDELAGGEPPSTRFVPAEEAEPCPKVKLMDRTGQWATFRPGQRGYVESGYVTMIVVWKPNRTPGRAAARYVSDCVRQFGDNRVRGIGIVQSPPTPQVVEDTELFATRQGLALDRIYFDNWNAFEELQDAVGGEGKEPNAAVFIVDRRMRMRFYRGVFMFATGQWDSPVPGTEAVEESVPEGRKIRDYLFRILEEGL